MRPLSALITNTMELRDRVRDVRTGFEGEITGLAEYTDRRPHARVEPFKLDESGAMVAYEWVDLDRLEKIGS